MENNKLDDFNNQILAVLDWIPLDWEDIDWYLIKEFVLSSQIEIFESTKAGEDEKWQELQLELINHGAARLLAVLRVTQENKGRNTPGIDNLKSKDIKDRISYAQNLCIDGHASKIWRVWIDKKDKPKSRPLGIPTIEDWAKQMLVKLALEPEWEARFEEHSYGFRPGRSPLDAVIQVRSQIKQSEKYFLDADIEKCFDWINHKRLLDKIGAIPIIREQLKAWLKAGIMDELNREPEKWDINPAGTPQGGIISPLLCNIALHGMYECCISALQKYYKTKRVGINWRKELGFIWFADDFLICHPKLEVILLIKEYLSKFLKDMDLNFSEEKTWIVHSLNEINLHKAGVIFLGFRVFQFRTVKHDGSVGSIKGSWRLGFKVRIIPDPKKVKAHLAKVKEIIKSYRGSSQQSLIKWLNPIIKGWSNYYKYAHSTKFYSYLDSKTTIYLYKWGLYRHGNKGKRWVYRKYFGTIDGRKWWFRYEYLGMPWYILSLHFQKIQFTWKVAGSFSPFSRKAYNDMKFKSLSSLKESLYKRQNGNCAICGQGIIKFGDPVEVHHLLPKGIKGWNSFQWLRLVHVVCHDRIHSGIKYEVEEEPDEE